MIVNIILLVVCVILVYAWRSKTRNYWKKRNIREVKGFIPWKFLIGDRSLPEYFKEIYDKYDTHVAIDAGSQPTLLIRDLEDVQAVLASDFQSFYSRGIKTNTNDLLADNLLFMDDFKKWRILRQKLSPVFTSSRLKNMFYIMDRCAVDFVEMLKQNTEIKKKPYTALYTYTTASIGACVFGIDTNLRNTMDSPFLKMAWKAVEPSFKLSFISFINGAFPRLFRLLGLKIFGEHEKFFIGAVKSVMQSREMEETKRHDFIDICIELQRQGVMHDPVTGYTLEPTYEVLAAQAFFFFLAGADTSANSMHFTLLELASNPQILAKVHDEIDSIFEDDKKTLTYNDIEKLQYLDMVLSESIRKTPNIGTIQRRCTRDTTLPGSKVKIETDTVVVIPVFGIHRDEKYFPEPEVFNPERFAPENLSKLKKFSYLPFGEGNRICIGNRFARLQLKVGLAWLLRRYTLAEQQYKPDHFERSTFSLRDTNATYDLIPRDFELRITGGGDIETR